MNDLFLIKAEKWFAELSVKTIARPTCLMVNRADLEQFGSAAEVLVELRSFLGCNRVYWGEAGIDKDNLYLQSI
jgi:hypothetical protein